TVFCRQKVQKRKTVFCALMRFLWLLCGSGDHLGRPPEGSACSAFPHFPHVRKFAQLHGQESSAEYAARVNCQNAIFERRSRGRKEQSWHLLAWLSNGRLQVQSIFRQQPVPEFYLHWG